MQMISSIKGYFQRRIPVSSEKNVVEAYDIWSGSYDAQPGNLMLDLDEQLFAKLIQNLAFQNKHIADVGCGTGRHWPLIYSREPASLIGYDVSGGMLGKLQQKFPLAITKLVNDNLMSDLPGASLDCLISTLTIAHIPNLDEAIGSWARVLKKNGDLVVTDFHPAILARGGKRSFRQGYKSYAVKNYVYELETVRTMLQDHGFTLLQQEERTIDDTVKHYYEAKDALHVFEKYNGLPVIYGLRLKK